jgi:hypothetical protein
MGVMDPGGWKGGFVAFLPTGLLKVSQRMSALVSKKSRQCDPDSDAQKQHSHRLGLKTGLPPSNKSRRGKDEADHYCLN